MTEAWVGFFSVFTVAMIILLILFSIISAIMIIFDGNADGLMLLFIPFFLWFFVGAFCSLI